MCQCLGGLVLVRDLVHGIVTGTSPTLGALDMRAEV